MWSVALLAEGVDRNTWDMLVNGSYMVALLAEGVDRNLRMGMKVGHIHTSPSSRRAWIEIRIDGHHPIIRDVALLAEGVDRNICYINGVDYLAGSPSSRRAWIEIPRNRMD